MRYIKRNKQSVTEYIQEKIGRKMLVYALAGALLEGIGYCLYQVFNSFLSNLVVAICFILVIPISCAFIRLGFICYRVEKILKVDARDIGTGKAMDWEIYFYVSVVCLYNLGVVFKITLAGGVVHG